MLNWLVIGIGDITTKRVIPAILAEPRSSLYGILTRRPAKAESYPAKVFRDLATALNDGAINAVYVASPVFLHAPQTIQSLGADRHVLCEKPMGLDYASCHSWFTAEDGRRAWLLDPAQAGAGPLYDIGSHRIDLLNYFFGEPRCACGRLSSAVHRARVEDNATVMVEYRTGVRGIVDVRWHSRVARDEFRIVGTEGEMNLTPLNGPELLYPGGCEQLPAHANLHYPCVANFVDAALEGAPLLSSGSSAGWTD